MTHGLRIGIDLGGTKIEAAALDRAGRFVARRRVGTPQDYAASIEAIAALIDHLETDTGHRFARLGVGIPGSPSPATGLIRNANSTWLNNRPLSADLETRLSRPVRLANDANCMALSEATDGAGAGARSVFGVILGTGCGGGLVLDGQLIEGTNSVAGEWGHIPLPNPTPEEDTDCWCGRRNCLETWLSGPGLARDHAAVTGQTLTALDLIAAARSGDAAARASLDRHRDRLGRGLGMVVNLFDPQVIVLAGGLSNAPEIVDGALLAVTPHVFSDVVSTRVVRSAHGDSSGVRGAAWLWSD